MLLLSYGIRCNLFERHSDKVTALSAVFLKLQSYGIGHIIFGKAVLQSYRIRFSLSQTHLQSYALGTDFSERHSDKVMALGTVFLKLHSYGNWH